ncbi:MAG: hypothetical protein GXO25_01950 [Euryarchaeota archaeon]|nr:hypothetical protein [Euryarchaeota archaeon]
MTEIKMTKEELIKIKEVYQGIMSYASVGLFFRSGEIIGEEIAKDIPRENYFEKVAEILKERGWVEDVEFSENQVKATGSAEVHDSTMPTCNMLRGIIRKIYEKYYGTIVNVEEEKCESKGDPYCMFVISKMG